MGCPNRAMLHRLIEPNTYVSNQICARICARDAVGQVETRETRRDPPRIPTPVRRGQRGDQRRPETPETCVVWLITQRSRVQIPPPLPRPGALSRTEKGPLACGLLTVLCTRVLASALSLLGPLCVPAHGSSRSGSRAGRCPSERSRSWAQLGGWLQG